MDTDLTAAALACTRTLCFYRLAKEFIHTFTTAEGVVSPELA